MQIRTMIPALTLTLFCAMQASAQTPKAASGEASLAEIFDFMARYFETRLSTTVVMIRAALEPIAVLAVGTVVAVLARTPGSTRATARRTSRCSTKRVQTPS